MLISLDKEMFFKLYGYNPNSKLEEKFTQEYWGYLTMSVSLKVKTDRVSQPILLNYLLTI